MPSRTTPPAWRRAFLRALSTTANVTWAAKAAGVGATTVYDARRADPGFAKQWDCALTNAHESIARLRNPVPPKVGRSFEAEGLVVTRNNKGTPALGRVHKGRWGADTENGFLGALAGGYGVKMASESIGFSAASAWKRRRKWPGFREDWEAARAEGYARLEQHIIDAATNIFDPPEMPAAGVLPPISFSDALALLKLHRQAAGGRKPHWRESRVDPDAVRAAILAKLDLIERHAKRADETDAER